MERTEKAAFRRYRNAIAKTIRTGLATEHSHRHALSNLIEEIGGTELLVINEPSQVDCGAPDLVVQRHGISIGHIECKHTSVDLVGVENDEQLIRYRAGLPNLILTNYLDFRWYSDGELRLEASIGILESDTKVKEDPAGTEITFSLCDAFLSADAQVISDPRDLAFGLASKARLLRDCIKQILRQETDSVPLREMLTAYRTVLIANMSEDEFADMQAQTAAYGLFAARCLHDANTGTFTRQSAVFSDMTPFLRDVFGRIAGPNIDERMTWIMDELALLLDRADMDSILADFGQHDRLMDPVVHFYEDFLAAYDPELRETRGVYYTPESVVSYIVSSIDLILRNKFDLADGLATVSDEGRDVLILDPAVGTGTFLREVIACIRDANESTGLSGIWPEYVAERLLPRLFGFELLMAPYAICHLKLALEIAGTDTGFRMSPGQRLGVYLTNTLEEAHEQGDGALFAHEIAQEAASADSVKRDRPVMVVLGNPPYSGHSANKGEWITKLLRSNDNGAGTSSYFEVDGEDLGERNLKWLNDDYVKFIRFAQWRIERTGEGVLGFVTNHAYLDNPTFRGMRQSLLDTFDEVYLLDLHGNAKKKETTPDGGKDENVFDIQQGVAIGLFVKYAVSRKSASVYHYDLFGGRQDGADGGKYGWLAENDVTSTPWTELSPKSPSYLFVPRDDVLAEEYEHGWKVKTIFQSTRWE